MGDRIENEIKKITIGEKNVDNIREILFMVLRMWKEKHSVSQINNNSSLMWNRMLWEKNWEISLKT